MRWFRRKPRSESLVPDDTWTCHVCRCARPYERISVASRVEVFGRVTMRTNVRYCNDNPECAATAPTHSFTG